MRRSIPQRTLAPARIKGISHTKARSRNSIGKAAFIDFARAMREIVMKIAACGVHDIFVSSCETFCGQAATPVGAEAEAKRQPIPHPLREAYYPIW